MSSFDDIDIFEAEAPRRSPDAYRRDGSLKSQTGFLGPIINKHSGKPMTELSIGVEIGGREVEIPSMVPTLTEEERILLQNLRIGVDPVPKSIAIKAKRHAMERIKAGLNPFLPAEPQNMNLGGSVGQMNRRQQPKDVARPTPAQLANIGAAFADPLGMVDITGEYPEFPAAGVSTAEMVMQGPRSPSLMENLREGDYGAAALQGVGVIPVVGGAARAIRGVAKGADRLAKAQKAGFDTETVYYHATDKFEGDTPDQEFTKILPSERGKLGPGIYLSPNPRYSETYINEKSFQDPKFGRGGRVLPVFVRGKVGTREDFGEAIESIKKNASDKTDFAVIKRQAQEKMADDGFAGFKVQDELVIFDPKNVRSVNAEFEDLDSPELLKAEGGAIDINDIDIFEPVQNFVGGGGVGKKLLSGKTDDAEKGIGSIPLDDETVRGSDLQFLMNIGPEGIEKAQRLGGFPMPSLAITRQDLPFQSFGEITLVGSPTKFDPKRLKANVVFNADAYTVRAPQPFRIARKDADFEFREKYQPIAKEFDEGRVDNIVYELGKMEIKKTATAGSFSDVQRFFQSDPVADVAFLRDQGDTRSIPKRASGLIEQSELREMVQEYGDARKKWGKAQIDALFEPEEFFDASINRDFYTGQGRIFKPYTGEDVLAFMKRRRGAAQEEGAFSVSPGKLRASLTERLNSLKQIRDQSARLVDNDKFTKFKDDSYERVTDLAESLKPFYRFDSSGFRFYDEVIELLIESEKRGLPRVMDEFGFDDVPESVVDEIQGIKSYFRTAPTEYFEAKPQRLVDLEEFEGAIVPEGTSDDLVQALKDAGIQIETYADDAQRLAARKKFEGTAFSVAGGMTLVGLMAPEESYAAGPSNFAKVNKAVQEQSLKQAKEQGYDLDNVMYHASKQDIDEFVPGYDDGLVFLTPNKEFANNWLGKGRFQERQGGTGAIEGVRAEKKRFMEEQNEIMKSMPEDQRQKYYEEVVWPQRSRMVTEEREADAAIYPVVTRAKKPFVPSKDVDVLEELFGEERFNAPLGGGFPTYKDALKDGNYLFYENKEVVDFLKSKGYDSMFLKESQGEEAPFTTLAVFEPSDIRSVNAKFDPKKKGSSKILASAPFAAGLGAMGMMQEARAATLQAEGAPFEVGLDFATSIAGPMAGGIAGIAEFTQGLPRRIVGNLTGEESAARIDATNKLVREALNYDPTSEIGREMSQKAQEGIAQLAAPVVKRLEPVVTGAVEQITDPQNVSPLGLLYQGGKYLYEDIFGDAEREAAKSAMDVAL
jgi:hypothetical protein